MRRIILNAPLLCTIALLACAEVVPQDATGQAQRETTADEADIPDIRLEEVFTGISFTRPVQITHAGDGSNRLFVIEQAGRVRVFENSSNVEEAKVFLDIRERVFTGHNEEGLLALAFHPKYQRNGEFFVYYSAGSHRDRRTVLSRFKVSEDDPDRADVDSEEVILEISQPWGNHNGGTILFGPEGHLYLSIGDGGHAGDPRNNAQNLESLLGTIIRINVNQRAVVGSNERADAGSDERSEEDPDRLRNRARPYTIPPDNPFVNREGARPEIYAYGLRNVWRMSFDRETDTLWAGDVGQVRSEAIYVIRKGENYGWNITEGSLEFRKPREGEPADPIVDPIVEHGRREAISITGGYVYRGGYRGNERLRGVYLYGDYGTGRIWGLRQDVEAQRTLGHREVFTPESQNRPHIASFGEDEAGEIYICAFDEYDGRRGRIYHLRVR